MCTVLLRFAPGARVPLMVAAVRDEFVDRPWDPPARHWDGPAAHLLGGRDRTAGGTWLAVDPDRGAVAALLNGFRREPHPDPDVVRPTRGTLALRVLTQGDLPEDLSRYDRFHLLLATSGSVEHWSWDAEELRHVVLDPGAHIAVNAGVDSYEDPLVPHFLPLLESLPTERDAWIELLRGDRLDPGDERALLVRRELEGRTYGTTSASLISLSPAGVVGYDFTATPADPSSWQPVALP